VSRKPSTIGFKTKAAGAQTDLALGLSSSVKVIAVSFQGFIAATWLTSVRSRSALLRRLFEEKVSKTVNTFGSCLQIVVLWSVVAEDTLSALGHLPEYPTCSKAMRWFVVRCYVNFAGFVEPFLEDSFVPRNGFNFLVHGMMIGCSAGVHPLCPSGGWPKGLRFPVGCLGFLGAFFHRTILLYCVCQIGKVQYAMAVEGIKDSLIRAIVAKYRDRVVVAAIFYLGFNK